MQVTNWSHPIKISYIWLRDHCHCPSCYNYDTQQRRYDVNNIPLNLRPVAVIPNSKGLDVEC